MKFSEMTYTRPDMDALGAEAERITGELERAGSFAQADAAFLEHEALLSRLITMRSLASIRHDINTRDEFYDREKSFFDGAMPRFRAVEQKWTLALLASPFRGDFEKKYGELLFTNEEMALKTFSPAIVEDMARENALTGEYDKLIASARIPFEGGVYTLSQLSPFKNDPDDARRLAAWKAEGAWYKEHQPRLDAIYDELVHLRDKMGRALGYDGYTELGYYRMERNCYTREDVEAFRAAVRKYLVPVADSIYRRQAERLGKTYPMSFADNALEFRSGNPRPVGTPEDILAQGRKFYHELSPETAEFIDFMLDNELLDVLSRDGKRSGGYCSALPDYGRAPFIFANFNGTSHDVEVMTHEAGHAFAGYLSRNTVSMSLVSPSLEACEVHSMSMEFFAWPWEEGFFGPDARKFYYTHLSGALTFIPYGTMVDHFQHVVYGKPDLSPVERHGVWKELLGVYMPWMKLDGEIPFYAEGQGWQRQHHIYTRPFYYIDYCLAQTMALQFWAMMQADREGAWAAYMKYTEQGGRMTFRQLIDHAGLASPFGEDCLRKVCAAAKNWLDSYDLTGLD